MVISIRGILAILFLSLTCFLLVSTQTSAQVTYLEDFPDPLGGWTTRWFYQNTNAENYYVASGDCNPNNRGNEPNGMWISDDRGCNTMVGGSPVRINFLNNFGDDAISFSIGISSCLTSTVLNIYDKDGVLVNSETLPGSCFSFPNYSYPLSNGISAFEFVNTGGGIEGNTAIDNVTLIKGPTTSVSGTVSYIGLGTGPISIAAFDGTGCGDGNYTETWIPEPGPYTLNLSPGTYYICVCRDTNGNGTCPDSNEPASGYDLNPVVVPAGAPVTGIDISLQGQLPPAEKVPTMTEWGMIILIGLLGMASTYSLRKQRII
jgi:hypothetical protein